MNDQTPLNISIQCMYVCGVQMILKIAGDPVSLCEGRSAAQGAGGRRLDDVTAVVMATGCLAEGRQAAGGDATTAPTGCGYTFDLQCGLDELSLQLSL